MSPNRGAAETLTSSQQLTTVTSPTKPRLITISPRTPLIVSHPATPQNTCPALVSTFSPDTPPETPDLANRNEVDEYDNNPTSPDLKARGPESLDTTICHLFTPPLSRNPTPFVRTTSSTCFPNSSFQVPPAMTQLDPCTGSILEDLEIMLADFPITTFRLNSPVLRRIRCETWSPSRAPHSRYFPYKPGSGYPTSPENPQNPSADPTTYSLRTIFPIAHPHDLDSLQATYLALHYVINLLSKEFSAASASEAAASPSTTYAKHSRSSSIVSNIPSKAIAMLGLGSPIPSPAMSWFRASSHELDSDTKTRLENVQLLLEATVKKTLVKIEGRPLDKHDGAMIRAVGEVIKMGERKGSV
ncbi:MAG: hypothetical protein LQ350_002098 [Teloschistes chrysophthalmus]|nr:MAG: hypothetical protein LQ350_002098 [Niorma chrysophthalma]